MKNYTLILCLFVAAGISAQNTVGLLSYDRNKAYDGYNLMFPHNQPNVYLLDNCGEIVHTWEDDANFRPGNVAYIRADGSMVKAKRDALVTDDAIWAGGGGEFVEIRSWDNDLIWSFELNDSLARLHHDIAPMPNGNILMIAWELKSGEEAIAAGRDTAKLDQDELWPDCIIEVNPNTDEIVWEWHVWDHMIQDLDSTKNNYGVVGDHPELVDINWDTSEGHPDWMHANALDYNEELDQIIISVPTFHEFWIIDHSTTTAEAATHSGGFSGLGGDIMYRWGNPMTYRAGTEADQQLFYPHDIHWVDEFVDTSFPNYRSIALFNNRVGADFSTVNVLTPAWDMYSWEYTKDAGVFEPNDFNITLTHPEPTMMHSTGLSSVQLLPNGNTLICTGRYGYSFELTPDNEIVWEYKTPRIGPNPATQGDTLAINNNLTFRLNRYPTDYAAFDGRDLSPKGWIELEPDEEFCDELVSTEEFLLEEMFKIYPNPTSDLLVIEWDGVKYVDISVHNLLGHKLMSYPQCSGGRKYMSTSNLENGLYLVTLGTEMSKKIFVQH